MRRLRYLIVFAAAAGLVFVFNPFVVWLSKLPGSGVFAQRPSPSWGIAASLVSSLLGFAYIVISQNRAKAGMIRRYRRAEELLIGFGKMKAGDILEYHRSYNWHAYAGLGFSTLFIIVPLFFTDQIKTTDPLEKIAILLGLGLLGFATVILGIIDLFHTNTLTPLVTTERRFALIDVILKFGGLALMLQICAAGVFLSLINSWLSVAMACLSLWLMIFITERRGVPIDQLVKEHGLTADQRAQLEISP
jgi:hypothetical protein